MDLFLSGGRGQWLLLYQSEGFLALQVKRGAYFRDRVSFFEFTESDKRSMMLQKLRIPVCLNFPLIFSFAPCLSKTANKVANTSYNYFFAV